MKTLYIIIISLLLYSCSVEDTTNYPAETIEPPTVVELPTEPVAGKRIYSIPEWLQGEYVSRFPQYTDVSNFEENLIDVKLLQFGNSNFYMKPTNIPVFEYERYIEVKYDNEAINEHWQLQFWKNDTPGITDIKIVYFEGTNPPLEYGWFKKL